MPAPAPGSALNSLHVLWVQGPFALVEHQASHRLVRWVAARPAPSYEVAYAQEVAAIAPLPGSVVSGLTRADDGDGVPVVDFLVRDGSTAGTVLLRSGIGVPLSTASVDADADLIKPIGAARGDRAGVWHEDNHGFVVSASWDSATLHFSGPQSGDMVAVGVFFAVLAIVYLFSRDAHSRFIRSQSDEFKFDGEAKRRGFARTSVGAVLGLMVFPVSGLFNREFFGGWRKR